MLNKFPLVLISILVFQLAPVFVSADAGKEMTKKEADIAFSKAERQLIEKYYDLRKPVDEKKQKSDDLTEKDDNVDKKNKEKDAKHNDRSKEKAESKDKGKSKNKQKSDVRKEKDDDVDKDDKGKEAKQKDRNKEKAKGKNKQKTMPKGIAMKLKRGGAMPPGIAKTSLPEDLEQQLPPAPNGYERIEAKGKVILVDIATGVIADIIKIGRKSMSTPIQEKAIEKTNDKKSEPDNKSKVMDSSEVPDNPEKKWWQIWKD
jgi:hypothetical protein